MTGGSSLRTGKNHSSGGSSTGNKRVSFDSVSIYEFAIRMGENPSCSRGCPIALEGFQHINEERRDLEAYTQERSTKRRGRELIIPADVRTMLLIKVGYQFEDVVLCTTAMLALQEERKESLEKASWDEFKSIVFRLRLPLMNPLAKLTRGAKTA